MHSTKIFHSYYSQMCSRCRIQLFHFFLAKYAITWWWQYMYFQTLFVHVIDSIWMNKIFKTSIVQCQALHLWHTILLQYLSADVKKHVSSFAPKNFSLAIPFTRLCYDCIIAVIPLTIDLYIWYIMALVERPGMVDCCEQIIQYFRWWIAFINCVYVCFSALNNFTPMWQVWTHI